MAYENGFCGCYYLYDEMLYTLFNALRTPSGNLIPIIVAIGNHDAQGFLDSKRIVFPVPFFMQYFPHRAFDVEEQSGHSFSTTHYHILGDDEIMFVLDTNTLLTPDEQVPWLVEILQTYSHFSKKYALYHYPLYPGANSWTRSKTKRYRDAWERIFCQLVCLFELQNNFLANKSLIII
jgi:hypothetical protein